MWLVLAAAGPAAPLSSELAAWPVVLETGDVYVCSANISYLLPATLSDVQVGQEGRTRNQNKVNFHYSHTQIECQDYSCTQSGGQANDYLHKTFDFIATSDNADSIYDCSVNLTYTVDNTLHDNSFSCSGPWTRYRGRLFLLFHGRIIILIL